MACSSWNWSLERPRPAVDVATGAGPACCSSLTNEARLLVARKDAKAFTPVATYTVADSSTWAHPVVAGGRVLVKEAETLAAWSLR